jgi:hypothetical protein
VELLWSELEDVTSEASRNELFHRRRVIAGLTAGFYLLVSLWPVAIGLLIVSALTSPISLVVLFHRRRWRGWKWALVMMIPVVGGLAALYRLLTKSPGILVLGCIVWWAPLIAMGTGAFSFVTVAPIGAAAFWGQMTYLAKRRSVSQVLLPLHAMPTILFISAASIILPFIGQGADADHGGGHQDHDGAHPEPLPTHPDHIAFQPMPPGTHAPVAFHHDVGPIHHDVGPIHHEAGGVHHDASQVQDHTSSSVFDLRHDAVTGDVHVHGSDGTHFDVHHDPVTGDLHGGGLTAHHDSVTGDVHVHGSDGTHFDVHHDPVTGDVHAGGSTVHHDPVTGDLHGHGPDGDLTVHHDSVTGGDHVNVHADVTPHAEGWYFDPFGSAQLRWHDGHTWTDQLR